MKKIQFLFVIAVISVLAIKCTSPNFELTGVVQDGLDGETISGVEVLLKGTGLSTVTDSKGNFSMKVPCSATTGGLIEEINSTLFLKESSTASDMVLIADKSGYQQLEYKMSSRITDLTLNILPEPPEFRASDYTGDYIPFTSRLEHDVLWEDIIDGIRLFYEKRVEATKPERELYWNRDLSTPEAYVASIAPNRANFRSILGAVDDREYVSMEKLARIAETDKYVVYEVRWSVLKEVVPRPALQDWPELDVPGKIFGEGLLLETKGNTKGYAIAIPDADQDPEDLVGMGSGIDNNSQFARRLAENGFTVVVPVVIDRTNRWSRNTNRPSRTWIYSQAHEMGRTVAGYEVQKMEAVIDWFAEQGSSNAEIGIAGYGEGGLLAFYTASLDTRVKATLVSGYFAPREEIWKEPIYRNVWSLLREFGDAELASLIAPRSFVVEYSMVPDYNPAARMGRMVEQMVGHTQLLLRDSEYVRKEFVESYTDQGTLRDYFKQELIG